MRSSWVALAVIAGLAQATPVMRMRRQNDPYAQQTGDLTFYNTGMTSCGYPKADTDLSAAVSQALYDTFPGATANPNLNPICGKMATVTNPVTGKTVRVSIDDRCTGCNYSSIDLTPAAYDQIADQSSGRVFGVQWQIDGGSGSPPTTSTPPPPPPPSTTEAPPPPPSTTQAPPSTTDAPPPPTTTAVPTSTEDPCPPEETSESTPTATEDPCPPEETTTPEPTATTTEDPCPPEETSPVPSPTESEDPCPPEETSPVPSPTETEDPCPPEETSPAASPVNTGSSSNGSAKAWDANAVYVGGDQACQDGKLYKASWWTQNEKPPSQVWVESGSC